jgi:hypothetical protein
LFQGIDLSNIVTSLSGHDGEDHPILASAKRLSTAADSGECETILADISHLLDAIPGESEGKTIAGNAGAIEAAVTLLDKHKENAEISIACLKLIELLITQNELNRDKLKEPLSKPRIANIVEALNSFPDDADVQELGFKVARLGSTKSESIKVIHVLRDILFCRSHLLPAARN